MANDETNRCSNCSKRAVNRRELLMLAGATTGLVVLGGAVSGCGNPTGTPPTGPVAAGNMSALSVGSLLVMTNFVVARDANGVYAMSAVCTHAGCLLDDGASTIAAGLDLPVPRIHVRWQWRRYGRPGALTAAALRGDDCRRRRHHRGRQPGGFREYPHAGRMNTFGRGSGRARSRSSEEAVVASPSWIHWPTIATTQLGSGSAKNSPSGICAP
jgi:Rieske [2Fe-2S] domain